MTTWNPVPWLPWKEPTEEFKEGESYSPTELEAYADQLLKEDRERTGETHGILNAVQIYGRKKKEILNDNGIPDPSIESGLYWRTHPEGRTVATAEERGGTRGSYYKR